MASLPCSCPNVLSSSRVFTRSQGLGQLSHLRLEKEGKKKSVKIIARFLNSQELHYIVQLSIISSSVIIMPLKSCVKSHSVCNYGIVAHFVTETKKNNNFFNES